MKDEAQKLYPSVWDTTADAEAIFAFAEDYKQFLNTSKTEREAIRTLQKMLEAAGYLDLERCYAASKRLQPGQRVYLIKGRKAAAVFTVGRKPLQEGMRLITAHIDSPRLDVRPNPFEEHDGLLTLKTHYYGGIKKYQWVAQPLSLHGTIVKKDGAHIDLSLGEGEDEPVFYISDLPKHLSARQMEKSMEAGIQGEDLRACAASVPQKGGTVRARVLSLMAQRYGLEEKDLVSAELELVPAGKARDVGLDRSLISSYGHDDRICAYTALRAALEVSDPVYSTGVFFADKEEVGSVGNTGMQSRLMENAVAKLHVLCGGEERTLRTVLERSCMLSADVCVGYDPLYGEAFDEENTAHLGCGPVFTKYAGHNGKKGCNDASAEYLACLRRLMDERRISWQTGEMGRIDLGGGGTIAPFAAAYGMETVDFGVALLSMHAPYELASKADVYEAYRAYVAFLGMDGGPEGGQPAE